MITCTRRSRAALVAVALVLAALVGACTPPPAGTPAQQVEQIITFVERARGHEFHQHPTVDFLSDADFRAAVLANLSSAEPGVRRAEAAFKALGWLAPSGDLYHEYQVAFGSAVVGFYDPTTKVLDVRGTTMTPYRREVIAHELTHALDDQWFALDDDFGDGLLGERTFASLVAIEGDAVRVQQRYFASMSGVDQAQDVAEQLTLGNDPRLLTVPVALLTFTQAPYIRGGTFAYEIASEGGTPALDAMLERYPSTAEQAFDTDKYLADEPAVPVSTPPVDPGGVVADSGTWGQFLLTLVLHDGLALDSVDPVTDGWAGDAFVTWTAGTQHCLRLDTKMDTATEATTLSGALSSWASSHPGATVAATAPDTVRLTSCR
jgi:hypothetical protein